MGGAGIPAGQVIVAIADFEKAAKLQKDSLLWLFKASDTLVKLYDLATKLVPAVKAAEKDPGAKLKFDEKYLSPEKSAVEAGEASALAVVAAWDRWMLETDGQMESAVSAGIDGAAAYRTQLREHAIDGKLMTEAQAMAVKTSGEYVQAVLSLVAARESVERMTALRTSFMGQEDALVEAKTAYFDRLEEARTNILVRMRTVQLAHQYETLTSSKVRLDPLKDNILSYKEDAYDVVDELEQSQSLRGDDPSRQYHRLNIGACTNFDIAFSFLRKASSVSSPGRNLQAVQLTDTIARTRRRWALPQCCRPVPLEYDYDRARRRW